MTMHSIAWWPTVAVVAIATATDLRTRRIPNWLVGPFAVAGLLASAIQSGWHGLAHSIGGMALGLALLGVLALKGGMGMGDVKLCAAIGAWIWSQQLLFALLLTGIAGGVIALVWLIANGSLGDMLRVIWRRLVPTGEPVSEDGSENPFLRKMPYAPAIAIGTLISFFPH